MSVFDLTDEQVGALTKALEDAGVSATDIVTTMDSLPGKIDKAVQLTIDQNKNLQDQVNLLEKSEDSLKAQGEWAEAINQINIARMQQEKNNLKMLRDQGLITQDIYETELLILKAKQEEEGHAHNAGQNALNMAQTLTGVSGAWKGTLIGSFFQGDFNKNIERAGAALKENFSAANMLGSALMKVAESTMMMVVSADAQFAEVNKLTNGTGEYNDMIMDTMANNQQYNVSVEDAGEAVKSLYTEMSNFSNMSKEAQAAAVETTAQLKGLGIDAQTTAANFEIMTGALGMSSAAAGEAQKDFAAMAADLGVSAGKIAKDFERNADVFVAYGDDATQVFKDVAAAAKATGIEMDALLGITTQFDTFEGAAKAAGQLNAVLGGGLLNSMDLLNASEEERVRMLISSVEASGKSWQSMSKFEKQAVANAAGIKDMTQASKLFGQSLAEYDAAQAKVEDNAEAQAKLEERAAAAANMQDKLKRIMEQFAVAVQPIINAVHFLLDGLLSLNDMTGGMLIPTLIGLATAMMAIHHWSKLSAMWSTIMTGKAVVQATAEGGLAGAKAALTTATAAQTAAAPAAATGSKLMAKGIQSLGRAAAMAGPKLMAILGPIGAIAVAVAAPILLLAVIIWSMKELVLAFMAAPEAIIPAMLGLMAFIGVAAVGLPILGAAFSAFFIALGNPASIAAMTALMPVLPTMAVSFGLLSASLWILGKAIQEFIGKDMPGAMLLALASLWAFGLGLLQLGPLMKKSFRKVGINVGILAIALLLLGKALQEWNNVGVGEAMAAYISLWVFALALIPLAEVLDEGAFKVGVAVGILGLGLLLLGMGLQSFNDVGVGAMIAATVALIIFGLALNYIVAPALTTGALMVGGAAILLGIGLILLAKGIGAFEEIPPGLLIGLPIALAIFGWGLLAAGIGLAVGGTLLLWGALLFWPASHLLLSALKPWLEFFPHMETLRGLGGALKDMTTGMVWAGIKLAIGSWFLLYGAVAFLPASLILTHALQYWLPVLPQLEALSGLGMALLSMTHGMITAGIKMLIAGIFLLPGAVLVSAGLKVLAWGLEPWTDGTIDWERLPELGWVLARFSAGLGFAGLVMAFAGIPFFFGAVMISLGMRILNKPLAEFANTLAVLAPIAPAMPAIASGLASLGRVLPGFGWGILMLGIAASMPFFRTGLKTLSSGLSTFANAIGSISEEKAVALGHLFKGLSKFTALSKVGRVLRSLGWGIWWIARGLRQMPEGVQAVQFSVAAESLAELAEASVNVTPEAVENVKGLADAAIDYGIASRLMRSSGEDALVQALRELAGPAKSSAKGGKEGQDVVLEIDGKEFARAVSAAIDSKHNMPF